MSSAVKQLRPIAPLRYPVKRLDDLHSLSRAIKNCDHSMSSLSLSCCLDPKSDKSLFLKNTSRLCKKIKYCRYLKVEKEPLDTSKHISKFLAKIKRLNTMRGLKLICSNSNVTTRINQFSSLKLLQCFNRLDTVIMQVFFVSQSSYLFEKFGRLMQSFRPKSLTVKEPLCFTPEVYGKYFYSKLRATGQQLACLKLSNYTPFLGPIELFSPYKLLQTSMNLQELHLNFIGINLTDKSFASLTCLIKSIKRLSFIDLDFSFNQISKLDSLIMLHSLPLTKVHLDFSHCPLDKDSFSSLAQFLNSTSELLSLKLILKTVNMDERSAVIITSAIRSLQKLTSLSFSLGENKCLNTSTLHTFLHNILSNHSLTRVELGLSRAFVGGFPSDLSTLALSSKSMLEYLSLDLSNNRLRDYEIFLIMLFCRRYTDLKELRFSIENCTIGDRAAEAIWKWISSLKSLQFLEISLLFSNVNEICLLSMLKNLLVMNLKHLALDLTDILNSKNSAQSIWLAILAMKGLESFKICSNFLKQILPRNFTDLMKSNLPNCSKFEFC